MLIGCFCTFEKEPFCKVNILSTFTFLFRNHFLNQEHFPCQNSKVSGAIYFALLRHSHCSLTIYPKGKLLPLTISFLWAWTQSCPRSQLSLPGCNPRCPLGQRLSVARAWACPCQLKRHRADASTCTDPDAPVVAAGKLFLHLLSSASLFLAGGKVGGSKWVGESVSGRWGTSRSGVEFECSRQAISKPYAWATRPWSPIAMCSDLCLLNSRRRS